MNIEQQRDSSKNNTRVSDSPSAKTKPNSLFCHTDPVKLYLETCCCQQLCQDYFILELQTQLIDLKEKDGKYTSPHIITQTSSQRSNLVRLCVIFSTAVEINITHIFR